MQIAPRSLAFALVVLLGCSKKPSEARPEPVATAPTQLADPAPPPPVVAAPTPAPVVVAETGVPADFPPSCVAYAALIEKLQGCDKVGPVRDSLARGYHELRAAWPSVQPAQRPAIDAQCKTQADSLRDATAATCAW